MNRKQRQQIRIILTEMTCMDYEQSSTPIIRELDNKLHVSYGGPTEEGYSYTGVAVYPLEDEEQAAKGYYAFEQRTVSRDCDGKTESWKSGKVKLLDKSKRRYLNFAPGQKKGRFTSKRLAYLDLSSKQRDYSAEAMGY